MEGVANGRLQGVANPEVHAPQGENIVVGVANPEDHASQRKSNLVEPAQDRSQGRSGFEVALVPLDASLMTCQLPLEISLITCQLPLDASLITC